MQRFGEAQCIGMGNDAQVNWGLRGRRMARIKLIRLLSIRFYLLWTLWVWVYWFWMNYKFIIFFYNNYVTIFFKGLLILHLFIFLHDFHLILDYSYMNFLSTFFLFWGVEDFNTTHSTYEESNYSWSAIRGTLMILTLTGSYKRSLYHRLIFLKIRLLMHALFDPSLALLNPMFPPSFGGSFYNQSDECAL